MLSKSNAALQRRKISLHTRASRLARRLCAAAVVAGVACFSSTEIRAQERVGAQSNGTEIVVRDDLGGFIRSRMEELRRIEAAGHSVRIERGACYSTCTMYLGLENMCTTPFVTFGFHRPFAINRRLSQQEFDYLSELIASYYPPPIKTWYLETGRYRSNGIYRIKGSEMIRLGVRAC